MKTKLKIFKTQGEILFLFLLTLFITGIFWFGFKPQTARAATTLTNVTNTPTSTKVSTVTSHGINFTTTTTLPIDGKILITFPDGFNVASAAFSAWSGFDGNKTVSVNGQVVTIARTTAGTVSTANAKSIALSGITNSALIGTNYTVIVETQDSVATILDGPTTSSYFSICTNACHLNVYQTPWDSKVSTTTKHTTQFTTASSLPADSKIKITFPAGFDVSGATFDSWSDFDGGESLSINSQTITITRNNTGTAKAAGNKHLVLNNILNHSTASSDYYAILETLTNGDVNLEGPTAIRFSITAATESWTLSASVNRSDYYNPGDTVVFSAVTSLPSIDPTTQEANQLQAYSNTGHSSSYALKFDGGNDYVDAGNGASLNTGTGDFSIEAWINTNTNLIDSLGDIVSKFDQTNKKGINLGFLKQSAYGAQSNYKNLFFGIDNDKPDTVWVEKAPQLGAETGILSLVVYNGKLYGQTDVNGKLYEWNGTDAWVEKAPKLGTETAIRSPAVYNGKLYVGTSPNGKLYEWNGTDAWVEKAPKLGTETAIYSLAVYNGKLYGATSPNGKLYEWNGTDAWVEKAPKLGAETAIWSLVVYNDKLYGTTNINAKLYEWNGTDAWVEKAPKPVVGGSALNIWPSAVYNGKLYGATYPSGKLYEWNGVNAWVERAPKLGDETGFLTLAVYNGKLYGGTYPNGKLYEWNGVDAWVERAPKLGAEVGIHSMAVYNGKLYGGTISGGRLYEWETGVAASYDYELSAGWKHIVAVRETASGTSVLKLYVNGAFASASDNFIPADYDLSNTTNFLIGAGQQDYFNGSIGDVRVWNIALNPTDILAQYNNPTSTSCVNTTNCSSANLVGHWAMSEGTGLTVADSSGNGNNGTLSVNTSIVDFSDPVWSPITIPYLKSNISQLTYSSTDTNGNYIWKGSYTIPVGTANGIYTTIIESASPNIETDSNTYFTSPPTDSNNTGITTNVSYTVRYQPASAPSLDSPRPPDLPNSPEFLLTDPNQTPTPPQKTDLNPQSDFRILINGNAEYTNSRTVKLKLFAGSDTKYMFLSENPNFTGAEQEIYTLDKIWTLSFGDGEKIIYAKFLTLYDISSKVVSASIILDTKNPALPVIISPQNYDSIFNLTPTIIGQSEAEANIILELSDSEGKTNYFATKADSNGDWDYIILNPLKAGDYTLKVRAQDQAGNLSQTQTVNFRIATGFNLESPAIPLDTKEPILTPKSSQEEAIPLPLPQEQEKVSPPQASFVPSNLQANQPVFKSLYGNITLKPDSQNSILNLTLGQSFRIYIKPKKPVKAIMVTLLFQKPLKEETSSLRHKNIITAFFNIPQALAGNWQIKEYTLKDQDNDGIYEGEITLPEVTGEYLIQINFFYEDGTLETLDTKTLIDPKGYIYTQGKHGQDTRIKNATITFYYQNPDTNKYEVWNAAFYGQQNPQTTDRTGEYTFLVPRGTYYLEVKTKNYQTYQGKTFQANEGDSINQNLELIPQKTKLTLYVIGLGSLIVLILVGIGIKMEMRKDKP